MMNESGYRQKRLPYSPPTRGVLDENSCFGEKQLAFQFFWRLDHYDFLTISPAFFGLLGVL